MNPNVLRKQFRDWTAREILDAAHLILFIAGEGEPKHPLINHIIDTYAKSKGRGATATPRGVTHLRPDRWPESFQGYENIPSDPLISPSRSKAIGIFEDALRIVISAQETKGIIARVMSQGLADHWRVKLGARRRPATPTHVGRPRVNPSQADVDAEMALLAVKSKRQPNIAEVARSLAKKRHPHDPDAQGKMARSIEGQVCMRKKQQKVKSNSN